MRSDREDFLFQILINECLVEFAGFGGKGLAEAIKEAVKKEEINFKNDLGLNLIEQANPLDAHERAMRQMQITLRRGIYLDKLDIADIFTFLQLCGRFFNSKQTDKFNQILQDIQNKISVTEDSIKRAYSADLFLMLDQIDKGQMTAREVMERTQEKLQQLGPVVERLLSEFLNPIIERVYSVLDRAGVFPPVDDEELLDQLNGQEVKIEYISPLAQAQKMSSLVNIEQYFAFIMSLAQANPNIVNKFNFEEAANTYGVNLGVPAKIIRSDDEYQEILAQQAQAQAEQEQQQQLIQAAQLAPQLAGAAKQATDAANDGNPALQQWLGMDGV